MSIQERDLRRSIKNQGRDSRGEEEEENQEGMKSSGNPSKAGRKTDDVLGGGGFPDRAMNALTERCTAKMHGVCLYWGLECTRDEREKLQWY